MSSTSPVASSPPSSERMSLAISSSIDGSEVPTHHSSHQRVKYTSLYSSDKNFHTVLPHHDEFDSLSLQQHLNSANNPIPAKISTSQGTPQLPFISILSPAKLTPLKTSHKSSTHHHNTTQLHTSNIKLSNDSLQAKSHICAHSQLSIELGKYVIFEENANLMSSVSLEIGPYVIFGAGSFVNYPLSIGHHVSIGANVTIEKNVRICSGVRIEDHSVVEEGTILESGFVYKGSPVRVVGTWMETKRLFERHCRDLYTKGIGWRDLRT
mmetsp:Transcript_9851/g.36738  ORF Transcript_9851/g.36738 Transcript_9851/m.36738 type:complete len:267 (-) Transcript_9851:1225-2025(-)|eukprot:CAMPEP_0117456244 /NCGR_PEP_ID=MMETSP0759-20121206/11777_2 /TAXON_ID=63605 /ORGANISM="Percolomonas cosmopolitus, Strain WS" /LENGTH=266 /DNA_ID=CAMNT_0005249577 /DNA_START=42 /DNA_END=842 /DNA_ORIENTATION=-